MTQIGIYMDSILVEVIEAEPKVAWRAAVTSVKTLARTEALCGESVDVMRFALYGGWYRTANRDGYSRGRYRATPMSAK